MNAREQLEWVDSSSFYLDKTYPGTYLLIVDKQVVGSFYAYSKAVSEGLVKGLSPLEFVVYPSK